MKRIKNYAPWVASVALLTGVSVFACKCGEQSSPSVAFAQAHEVFAGTVIDIALLEPVLPADPGDGGSIFRFD